MFFPFWNHFSGQSSTSAKKSKPQNRGLRIESLESRLMLSVSPNEFAAIYQPYDAQCISPNPVDYYGVVEITAAEVAANIVPAGAVTSILPQKQGSTLLIEGTNGNDWIKIQENGNDITVYSFGASESDILGQWPFLKNEISTIVFNGYGGNDIFNGNGCSIDCRLDGGTGNNTLFGGNGNDWIYSGSGNGTSTLNGGNGDNIVIGGFGSNIFYNTGTGSNCFVWMGEDNQWAPGNFNDNNDALLIFSNRDGDGNASLPRYPYVYATWTEAQVLVVANRIMSIYDQIGTYTFFQQQRGDYAIRFLYTNNPASFGAVNLNSVGILFTSNNPSLSTIVHEVGHYWNYGVMDDFGNYNPFWDEFWSISWQSADGNAPFRSGSVFGDFPSAYAFGYYKDGTPYSGGGSPGGPLEDWAVTIENVFANYVPTGASTKYLQKVNLVNQFFNWIKQPREARLTVVTTNLDSVNPNDGEISLREALWYVRPGGTITFDESMKGKTITLSGKELAISKNVTIDATGMNITIDADGLSGVFIIGDEMSYYWDDDYSVDGIAVTLVGLTIINGVSDYGGGIANYGTLTAINCAISDNTAEYGYGGGIENGGNATLISCVISGNDGGGIDNWDGTMTLINCVISGNLDGGIYNDEGFLTIINCTITGNSYSSNYGYGGGIYNDGDLTIYNSIVAGNTAYYGADIYNGATISGSHNLIGNGNGSSLTNGSSNNIVGATANSIFVNMAQGNYRLADGSPAIDKGNDTLIPAGITTDLDGNRRIHGTAVDIGAYEYGSTPLEDVYNAIDKARYDAAIANNGLTEEQATWDKINGEWRLIEINAAESSLYGKLDFSDCDALKILGCYDNQLTELNVSGCKALEDLDCGMNQLVSLNLTGCVALEVLQCDDNQLESLNVSGFTALKYLSCYRNQLMSLNITGCMNLIDLRCFNNQLETLDVSGFTALTVLNCSGNQLTELNVTDCTALTDFRCSGNQLETLNVSGFTALRWFYCDGNQLETLDVSGCTALWYFWCHENRLTSLKVSGCTSLDTIRCENNRLETLDFSGCTDLYDVRCENNRLASLNVTGCLALSVLMCNFNQLKSLDVSGCTALGYLDCSDNQLMELKVTGCTTLYLISCSNNQLTSLDISSCTGLWWLNNYYNPLKFSALPLTSAVVDEYNYYPQNDVPIASSLASGSTLADLSSEYIIDGTLTTYTWYYADGTQISEGYTETNGTFMFAAVNDDNRTEVPKSAYTEINGTFEFTGLQAGNVIYCEMKNDKFPDLTLRTTTMTIRDTVAFPYDLNNDDVVNIYDLIMFIQDYGKREADYGPLAADFNNDGVVNIYDLIMFIQHYGMKAPFPDMSPTTQTEFAAAAEMFPPEFAAMFGLVVEPEEHVEEVAAVVPAAEAVAVDEVVYPCGNADHPALTGTPPQERNIQVTVVQQFSAAGTSAATYNETPTATYETPTAIYEAPVAAEVINDIHIVIHRLHPLRLPTTAKPRDIHHLLVSIPPTASSEIPPGIR